MEISCIFPPRLQGVALKSPIYLQRWTAVSTRLRAREPVFSRTYRSHMHRKWDETALACHRLRYRTRCHSILSRSDVGRKWTLMFSCTSKCRLLARHCWRYSCSSAENMKDSVTYSNAALSIKPRGPALRTMMSHCDENTYGRPSETKVV